MVQGMVEVVVSLLLLLRPSNSDEAE